MVTAEHNPFRADRFHSLAYQFMEEDWAAVLARLAALNYSGAIVGPHGHGKTTFLHELGDRLEDEGFRTRRLFLNDRQRRFNRQDLRKSLSGLGPLDLILLDGAEQLRRLDWHAFRWRVRKARGLIVTCHEGGLLPTLYECSTSHAVLDTLLEHLVPDKAHAWRDEAHSLYDKHRGNIREVWFSLYDRCAEG